MWEMHNPFDLSRAQKQRALAQAAEYERKRAPLEAERHRLGALQAVAGMAHGRLAAEYRARLDAGPADQSVEQVIAWAAQAGALISQMRALNDLVAHANAESARVEDALGLLSKEYA